MKNLSFVFCFVFLFGVFYCPLCKDWGKTGIRYFIEQAGKKTTCCTECKLKLSVQAYSQDTP